MGQLGAFINKPVRSYTYVITQLQELIGDDLGVDIEVIGAAKVMDAVAALFPCQASMITRNLGMGQDHRVIRHPSNGNFGIIQCNWTYRRQHILPGSTPIMVGKRNQRVIFIPNTKEVSALQYFAKRLIAADLVTLIEQSVECLLPLRMRMDKYQ